MISISANAQRNVKLQKQSAKQDKSMNSGNIGTDIFEVDSARIDSVFKQFDRKDCPGCAVAVINAGKIIFQKGYGMASLEHRVPIKPQTMFDIASISKQFTAYAILLLKSRGKISLDDDVRKYVPELPDFGKTIRIKHLVHHTSGLRDFGALLMMTGWERDSPLNTSDFLDIISRQKELNYSPGEKFLYNNTNYALMGLIVERIDGRTYSDFVNAEVLQPLGMNTTKVRDDPWKVVPDLASKYTPQKEGGYKVNYIWSFTKVLGPMGILASVEDLAKWDAAFYHELIGGKGIFKEMYSPSMLNSGKSSGHAFGLFAQPYNGLRRYLAEGSGGGSSVFMQFPDERLTVVVLCNRYQIDPSALAEKVADVVLEKKFDKKQIAGVLPSASKKTPPIQELRKFEGVYWLSRSTDKVKFSIDKGILTEQYNNEKPAPLAFLSDGRFFSKVEQLFYSFNSEKGEVLIESLVDGVTTEWERAKRKAEANLNQEQLLKYVGKYYSNELDLQWTIYIKDGKLYISRKKCEDQLLESLYKDGMYFTHTNHLTDIRYRIDFIPAEDGTIKEFLVSWGRLIGIVFNRVKE